jgi:hypothetical protein
MNRQTEDPQTVDAPRADAEYKADPGLHTITHGAGPTVSIVLA